MIYRQIFNDDRHLSLADDYEGMPFTTQSLSSDFRELEICV